MKELYVRVPFPDSQYFMEFEKETFYSSDGQYFVPVDLYDRIMNEKL